MSTGLHHLRLDWGHGICSQDGPSHGYWQEDSAPCYIHFAAGVSSQHGSWLRVRNPKEQGRTHNAFYDLALEVIFYHFHETLLVTQVSPSHCGKELYRGVNARRQVSWGAKC